MSQINVSALSRRAHQKKKSLGAFLKKLIKKTPTNLPKLVKKADAEMWAETDCLACANCCKTMTPTYKKTEITRIAKAVGMSYQPYFDRYLKIDADNGDIVNQSTPCQHLGKDNKCKVYAIRPDDCRKFPHHVRKDFLYQVEQNTYLNNLPRCPASLRFVENLQRLVEGK